MYEFIVRKDIINKTQVVSNQLQRRQVSNLVQNAVIQQNNISTLNSKIVSIKDDIEISILATLEPSINIGNTSKIIEDLNNKMNEINDKMTAMNNDMKNQTSYEMNTIKNDIYDKINYEINVLKTDISSVSNNINVLKTDISNEVNILKTDIYDIRNEINTLKNAFFNVRDDLEILKNNLENLEIDSNINTDLSTRIEYLFAFFYHNDSKQIMDNFPL